MRQISLDTETTGLDPLHGHRVVEIGCVEMVNYVRTGVTYHVYLNPERTMPEEAYKVHGLSDEFLSDKPLFAHVVDEFLEFIGQDQMVIHNAAFDMGFLNHELLRVGRRSLQPQQALDTVVMARKKFPGSPVNLDALCRRFEIDLSGRNYHGALLDAELLADVYLELMGGKQVALGFKKEESDKTDEERAEFAAANQKLFREPRAFPASAEEEAAHAEFLKTIKEPLWSA